jgi:hypothetical protein
VRALAVQLAPKRAALNELYHGQRQPR